MKTLQTTDIIKLHSKMIKATGGSEGIKDIGLIESALNRCHSSFDGDDLYPGIIKKISVLTYSMINNHGFIDGNKRMGIAAMLILIKLNGLVAVYTQPELVSLGLGIASGEIKEEGIEIWIEEHLG